MARYPDVPDDYLFHDDIEALAEAGITRVPPGSNYRPDAPVSRGEMAAFLNRALNLPAPQPVPEPEPEPTPEGLYIPVLEGPILKHDGNPTVMAGFIKGVKSGTDYGSGTFVYENVLVRGRVMAYPGATIIFRDSELDGAQGNVAVAGHGGKIILERCEVWNAEDGGKNNVDYLQCTVHKLYPREGGHLDCHQIEGSAAVKARYSYFNAVNGSHMGNAAFMCKSDFAPGSAQSADIQHCYLNGGNYTVYGKEGPKGGFPTVTIRDTEWGGEARYGRTAGQVDWV